MTGVLDWAKYHKQEIITRLVKASGATFEEHPAAIFMAGLPGAGKTELSKNLITDSGVNFLRIDMDEIATLIPNYTPEKADRFRQPATKILNELFTYALRHNLDFIMDGTFGSSQAMNNIKRSLKRGYSAKIVYAYQDPRLAWQFTLAREKVEHRSIKFDGFIQAYYKTISNIKNIGIEFDEHISLDIAVKTIDNKVGEWRRNVNPDQIDKLLKVEYNKDKLIKYIKGA